jgi:serine/threonine protein phosphatase PrpC
MAANDNWLILAVTDGVSAGTYSHVAAELAARVACKLLVDGPSDAPVDWAQISAKISTRIVEEARIRGIVAPKSEREGVNQIPEVRELMSTTAVVARISRNPDENGNLAGELAVLAGDSGAYRIADGRTTVLLGGKDEDSFIASSQVRPLPGGVEPEVVKFTLKPGEAILLATDGVGDALCEGDTELGEYLGAFWSRPPTIEQFFLDTNFWKKTFDDDRTAVVAWNLISHWK